VTGSLAAAAAARRRQQLGLVDEEDPWVWRRPTDDKNEVQMQNFESNLSKIQFYASNLNYK
jgi:hypothetical protein